MKKKTLEKTTNSMQNYRFNFKKLLILFIAVLCFGQYAMASSYSAKMTAIVSSTGGGTVYVNTSNNDSGPYSSTSEKETATSTLGGNVTFYLFAKPDEGFELAWWSLTNDGPDNGGVNNGSISVNASTREDDTEPYTRYAVFKQKYKFYFSATASVSTSGGGTASVDKTTWWVYGEHWNSEDRSSTATFTAAPDATHYFSHWSSTDGGTSISTDTPYTATWTSNSTNESSPVNTTLYAVFLPKPVFYFSATAIASPSAGGSASANLTESSVRGENGGTTSAQTTATFTATPNSGYGFSGWSTSENGTIESTNNPYTKTITSTSTDNSNPTNTTMYAIFSPFPTAINADDVAIGEGMRIAIYTTLTPNNAYQNLAFSSDNPSIASVDGNGVITGVATGSTTITIIARDNTNTETCRTTINVSVHGQVETPIISFDPADDGESASCSITCNTEGAVIHYTTDGSTPTPTSSQYSVPFSIDEDVVVKAIAIMSGEEASLWESSNVAIKQYVACSSATPSIIINGDEVTFSSFDDNVTFYYTTNGDTPTLSSNSWTSTSTAITGLTNETVIKVIAKSGECKPSSAVSRTYYTPSGVSDGVVTLNDLEDHTWTYYAGVSSDVDGGNYNTNYAGKMYSPNPRNVKITYNGVNGITGSTITVKVSTLTGEDQTSFVYYKTLEEGTTEGQYPYQVISNPFSVRPSTGSGSSKVFYGFAGWKIVSGGEYINGYSNGQTLPLDANITFVNLPYPSVNCTSAEIVFETTWTQAKVQRGGGNVSHSSFNGGTYETNFCVINTNSNALTPTYPVTITGVEPDGSTTYSYTITGLVSPSNTSAVKMEYVTWNPNGAIEFQDRNVTIGRGVTCSGTVRNVTASDGGDNVNQTLKIESGTYGSFTHYSSAPTNSNFVKQHVYLGCDYDRAKNDNTKLTFTGRFEVTRCDGGSNYAQEACRVYSKSGSFMTDIAISNAAQANSYYLSRYTTSAPGRSRYLEIEGGEWYANISGGQDYSSGSTPNNKTAFTLRMKGGKVRGSIYGAAQLTNCIGDRVIVITGGQIGGWVAGAANGTQSGSGYLYGSTYVYFGGDAEIATKYQERTNHAATSIQNSIGGYVFASGCGYSSNSHAGEVTVSTNVVMADEAIVEYGVYGGGAYGYSSGTANVYVTGGHVESSYDSKYSVFGGVYGGARQNEGGTVNMYMTGGQIDGVTNSGNQGGGLFGGSNASGTIENSVKMVVTGGQVGTSTNNANIHGGGYGASTTVSQNVDVTLGLRDDDGVTSGTAVVYGDVYGGSALGNVNGTSATNTYHTNVTMNAGYIHGSLYGGALGNSTTAANVYGPVAVKVYGGSVKKTPVDGSGCVYGANNINGAPQNSVTVDIYGTNSAPEGEYALYSVYGGGNKANYTYGNGYPKVTVHNCDNSIEYVYGGGNAAAVAATDVTIYGGNKIGNVFGGGNGQETDANVNGNTSVKIYGGTIGDVYGGSNTNGNIGGTISVNVNAQAEPDKTACSVHIDNVYGGGNKAASAAGNITIGCAEHIGNVYGGANQANITGNINLNITSGHIDNVFGGNNTSGNITGNITVTVNDNNSTCGMEVGNVYGGGNKAAYGTGTNFPVVNIENGHLTGSVFGGGLGSTAVVTGNPQVTIGTTTGTVHIDGNVFGGGDAANVNGSPAVVVNNCNTLIGTKTDGEWNTTGGTVYGGGNAAHVTGSSNSTSVTINGGDIRRVFGGGNGEVSAANVAGNAATTIHGGTIHQAFAGSNAAGTISGTATISVDKTGTCDEKIDELYGGGNLAEGNAGTVTVACGAIVDDVYGGANQAKVTSDITLNITGGTIKRVFGGNNTSGNITGAITVNIDKASTCESFSVENVYGAGNQAAYAPSTPGSYPAVNIKNGTVTYDVYGGGLGSTATVTSNPTVLIDGGTVSGNVFGGGSEANTVGTTSVTVKTGTVTKDVYGGGALANVTGNTTVSLTGGTVTGNTYGGGLGQLADAEHSIEAVAAMVTGNTTVTVNGGKSNNVFGCNNLNGGPQGDVTVTITTGTITNNVYGGGNLAAATADPTVTINGGTMQNVYGGGLGESAVITGDPVVNISKTATDMTVVDVFGGGDAAEVTGNTTVNLTAGSVSSAFGGGNLAAITGTTAVNLTGATAANVYGGGNEAGVSSTATVAMSAGSVTGGLYGGCNSEGKVSGAITVGVTGGTVGSSTTPANVHGGGYGSSTKTGDNVTVTINGSDVTINGDVYGGSALGSVNDANTETTTVTLTNGTITGNLYGGGLGNATYAAGVAGKTVVAINGGTVNNVFGCNNVNGKPEGGASVTVTGGTINDNVYGGGNLAAASVSPVVTINGGTMDKVYGGGLGSTAVITGSPVVTINKKATDMTVVDVFGGGDAAGVTGNTTVNLTAGSVTRAFGGGNLAAITGTTAVNLTGATAANVYGGGNEAGVSSTTTIAMSAGSVTTGLYGGCNTNGTVGGDITVDVTGGTIGTDATHRANVHGGGYGNATKTNGDVTVNIGTNNEGALSGTAVIYGDIYGGSALGNVNNATTDKTNVTLNLGTIYGDLYGGGLGDASNAADVTGSTVVTINGGTVNNVFGCNNTNGDPAGASVTVNGGTINNNVYGGGNLAAASVNPVVTINNGTLPGSVFGGGKGDPSDNTHEIAMVTGNPQVVIGDDNSSHSVSIAGNVFGGGDAANVKGSTIVVVNACGTTIGTKTDGVWNEAGGVVYGGGNAAHIVKNEGVGGNTSVTINGGNIHRVFGGGNGEVNPANVASTASVNIHAGYIGQAFAGSNAQGEITGSATITVDHTVNSCGEKVSELYGGGNKAAGKAGSVNIACDAIVDDVYGGANQADVNDDITLNITGGTIDRVFGGNNTNGNISGSITINIEKDEDCDLDLNYVYGAGNQAAYAPTTAGAYPEVNILNGTVKKDVFGGGLGSTAIVTSNPTVKINGGDVTRNVFGGGSAADVKGNTTVTLTTGTAGSLYGGGEAASVLANGTDYLGNTSVSVNGGRVNNSIYGGGLGNTTTVAGNVEVSVSGGAITKDVYGGSGFGTVNTNEDNSTTITISDGTVSGDIYGGGFGQVASGSDPAYEADVNGNVSVIINGGSMRNVFGCNNANGAPQEDVAVTVNGGTISANIYGGGNLAAASVNPVVTINNGTLPGSVFGGGKGDPSDNTHEIAMVTGNPQVVIGDDNNSHSVSIAGNVFGGGDAANVKGATTVTVNKCNTLIGAKTDGVWSTSAGTVYGGGNAADVVKNGSEGGSTSVIVNGGDIYRVFGGGNGEGVSNPGANVANGTSVDIHAGNIHQAFAGSNAKGNITGTSVVTIDHDISTCNELVDEVYGGGNLAAGNAGTITVECGAVIGDLYGGANQADIGTSTNPSNITLNVAGGTINRVFGGNNTSGNIYGSITVNVEKADDCDLDLNYVYGAGNQAAYAPTTAGAYPEVNILNGTVKKDVFGGGLGATAVVTGNPQVNLTGGSCQNVYGGGNAAPVTGSTNVTINATSRPAEGKYHVEKCVYGGGLGATAVISNDTHVTVTGNSAIHGNVYGGGNAGEVQGSTHIDIK